MKEPTNETQIKFFDLLLDGASPAKAAEECNYGRQHGYTLIKNYKEYYLEMVQGKLALHAATAANVVVGAMKSEGKKVNEKMHVSVAQDVLDRIGLVKQDRMNIQMEGGAGIVFLPKKDDAPKDQD
jgi:hypothetical protein|tara:strand:+ start:223 stop:600 length:378 start_codon:yes stop_codon:yes gene_type:complete